MKKLFILFLFISNILAEKVAGTPNQTHKELDKYIETGLEQLKDKISSSKDNLAMLLYAIDGLEKYKSDQSYFKQKAVYALTSINSNIKSYFQTDHAIDKYKKLISEIKLELGAKNIDLKRIKQNVTELRTAIDTYKALIHNFELMEKYVGDPQQSNQALILVNNILSRSAELQEPEYIIKAIKLTIELLINLQNKIRLKIPDIAKKLSDLLPSLNTKIINQDKLDLLATKLNKIISDETEFATKLTSLELAQARSILENLEALYEYIKYIVPIKLEMVKIKIPIAKEHAIKEIYLTELAYISRYIEIINKLEKFQNIPQDTQYKIKFINTIKQIEIPRLRQDLLEQSQNELNLVDNKTAISIIKLLKTQKLITETEAKNLKQNYKKQFATKDTVSWLTQNLQNILINRFSRFNNSEYLFKQILENIKSKDYTAAQTTKLLDPLKAKLISDAKQIMQKANDQIVDEKLTDKIAEELKKILAQ